MKKEKNALVLLTRGEMRKVLGGNGTDLSGAMCTEAQCSNIHARCNHENCPPPFPDPI